jgi:NADPH:quinone reductase-like Zn-dependent oxidoreductase
VKLGDRVTSLFFQRWLSGPVTPEVRGSTLALGYPGVGREYAVLLEDGVYPAPDYLSDQQAATLPVAALTGWRALFEDAPLAPKSTILLQGTGGVSIFGLQFAAALGHTTIVTSSSDDKLDRARSMGASHVLNYRTQPTWAEEIKRLTQGRGVGFVLGLQGAGV